MFHIFWNKSRILSPIALAGIILLLGFARPVSDEFAGILGISALVGVFFVWFCDYIADAWGYCFRGGGNFGPTSSTGVWFVGLMLLIIPALITVISILVKIGR